MSVRGDILDTLATQLATITTANGYNSQVRSVYRDTVHSDALTMSGAYISIEDTGPDRVLQYASGNKIRCEMTINLFAQIRASDINSPPTDEASNLISDIRELVQTPINLGSYVRFVELGDVPTIYIGPDRITFDYPILINYWFDADSP